MILVASKQLFLLKLISHSLLSLQCFEGDQTQEVSMLLTTRNEDKWVSEQGKKVSLTGKKWKGLNKCKKDKVENTA